MWMASQVCRIWRNTCSCRSSGGRCRGVLEPSQQESFDGPCFIGPGGFDFVFVGHFGVCHEATFSPRSSP